MLTFTNLRCKPRFICDIQFSGFHIIIIIIIVSSETYIYILYIYIEPLLLDGHLCSNYGYAIWFSLHCFKSSMGFLPICPKSLPSTCNFGEVTQGYELGRCLGSSLLGPCVVHTVPLHLRLCCLQTLSLRRQVPGGNTWDGRAILCRDCCSHIVYD